MKCEWQYPVSTFEEVEKFYPDPERGMMCWLDDECNDNYLSFAFCKDKGTWEHNGVDLHDINSDIVEMLVEWQASTLELESL